MRTSYGLPLLVALWTTVAGAATFTVTNTNDSGPGSLRQAISDANANPGPDTIQFAIGSGAQTITLANSLLISDAVVVDAQTQPGFAGAPLIQLTAGFTDCFDIIPGGNGSTVRGFVMNNCATAVSIDAASTIVQGNYIGTNAAGTAKGNNGNGTGVYVTASNCTIGGSAASARNVISGNGSGVMVVNTTGTLIEGNYLGTDATGTALITGGGVTLLDAPANTLSGNLIAGSGVRIHGTLATNNVVTGNLIGTNAAGTAALTNPGVGGIIIEAGASNTRIGGTSAAERNVISGNGATGITVSGSGTNGTLIEGNYIGTDINGTTALPNFGGINVFSSAGTATIGGTAPGAGNVISGNSGTGVIVGVPGVVITGNLIGTNAAGTAAVPNGGGISVSGANVTIGGTTAAARNVVSGNNGGGIVISTGGDGAVIEGNFIGTDITGTVALGNTSEDLTVFNSVTGATIGGTSAGARNVIAAAGTACIAIINSTGVIVQGNYVGTDVSGSAGLGCAYGGIEILGGSGNQIGGTAAGAGNVLAGSNGSGPGIYLNGGGPQGNSPTTGNIITGNLIGTNAAGTAALANQTGIDISLGSGNTIGGTAPGARNVISGNATDGISLRLGCDNNIIQGNFIGTNAAGTGALPNGAYGVFDNGANGTQVGGTTAGAGNRIRSNTLIGVWIAKGTGNAIRQNSISSNQFGISLGPGNVPNDPGDPDTGANNLQNFPVITSAVLSGGNTIVSGTLNSTASTTFSIDLFDNTACDSSGRGQGETYVASVQVTTDSSGNAAFSTTVASTLNIVTATATDPSGNTSEFSACLQAAQTYLSISDVSMAEGNSGTTPMIFTVTATPAPSITSTVQYATVAGTATAGTDYTTTSGTLTFNPGESTKTIAVNVIGDRIYEPDETFRVVLSAATNAVISRATATGVILNDDLPPPVASAISPSAGTVDGGTSVTITGTNFQSGATVTLGGAAATNVTWVDSMHLTALTPPNATGNVAVVVTDPDGQSGTVPGGFTYKPSGDANGDGQVSAADIFYLVNYLFVNGPAPVSGDANGDSQVTVSDIFYLVNYLFVNGAAPK